jgi:hypothetical protein
MSRKNGLARILIILGAGVLFLSAALHTFAAYPRVAAAVSGSNLSPALKAALRTVFLLVGWNWLVIGLLALITALRAGTSRKLLVVFLGASILVETGLSLAMMGVFLGNELLAAAAALLLAGGLLLGESGPMARTIPPAR